MNNIKIHIAFVLVVFATLSCNITDNEAPVPGYIYLESPVVINPANNLTDSHKITDVWVFSDGQILGVFPLPAKVPVIVGNNSQEITIFAGIRKNGMLDTPEFYPFYKPIIKSISPQPNQVISIPLDFFYNATAKIPVNEGFESGNVFGIDFDNNPATELTTTGDDFSTGQKSARVALTSSNPVVEVASNVRVLDGQNARGQSYIELDYKGQGEISVGIAKIRSGVISVEYLLFIPARFTWNKIYVDVTNSLSSRDYDEYRLVFRFIKTSQNASDFVYLDNIKHLHF
jgi:hypothetical protein